MSRLLAIWNWLLDESNQGAATVLVTIVVAVGGAIGWFIAHFRRKKNDPAANLDNRAGIVAQRADDNANQVVNPAAPVDMRRGFSGEEVRLIIEPIVVANCAKDDQIAELSRQLTFRESAVRSFFAILDHSPVPPEQLPDELARFARAHREFKAQASRLESEAPAPDDRAARASAAIEAGDYAATEPLLESVRDQALEEAGRARAAAAEASAALGEIAMIQRDYLQAAEHFRAAAEIIDGPD